MVCAQNRQLVRKEPIKGYHIQYILPIVSRFNILSYLSKFNTKVGKMMFLVILLQFFMIPSTWAAEVGMHHTEETIQNNPVTVEFKNGLFSISASKTPLWSILTEVEKQSGFTVAIDEKLKTRKVTANFSNLDIIKSLKAITNAAGLGG